MKIRNVSPNTVIKVVEVVEANGNLNINYIDEIGQICVAQGKIEIEDNKFRNATKKDWEIFMDMLAETAVPDSKIKDLKLEKSKIIDEKVKEITAKFVSEPQNIATLMPELTKLTANKDESINEMVKEEIEKIKENAKHRELFHVGGIQLNIKEDKVIKSIEIPKLEKKSRNIKTVTTKSPFLLFSFYKKKDNSPLKYSEVKTIDFKDIKISAKVSELTETNVFNDIFEINNNVLDKMLKDGIQVDKDGLNHSSMYRLIQITSKEDSLGICEVLKEFRNKYKQADKDKKFLKKDIDDLKKAYDLLLNEIIKQKTIPDGYSLYLNLQSNNVQRRTLAEKMLEDINSNIDALTGDYREVKALQDVYFSNILGTIKIPKIKTSAEDDIEPRTVWYVESQLGATIEPPKPSGQWCQGYTSKQIENFIRKLNK